jgi:hypothetical protein
MTLARFLLYIQYSFAQPKNVGYYRWAAMVKWYYARKKLGEPVNYP